MKPVRLFVYGLLKKGYELNYPLQEPDATFLGIRCTAPAFDIKDLGGAPVMIPGENVCWGELYEVRSKHMMDLIDSWEGGYNRTLIPLKDGEFAEAYIGKWPDKVRPYPSVTVWERKG